VVGVVQQIEDHAKLADTIASHLALKILDQQAILETTVVTERLEKVLGLIESEISVLQLEKRIRSRVKRRKSRAPWWHADSGDCGQAFRLIADTDSKNFSRSRSITHP
jgi:hypothetical protein